MENKIVITVSELASMLQISKPTAYQLLNREGFPSVRISPRRIVIPLESLKEWLKENEKHKSGQF